MAKNPINRKNIFPVFLFYLLTLFYHFAILGLRELSRFNRILVTTKKRGDTMKNETEMSSAFDLNNKTDLSDFIASGCRHIASMATAHGKITTDCRKLAVSIAATGTATEPANLARVYNRFSAEYLKGFGEDNGKKRWNSFITTLLRESKKLGFVPKAQKEKDNGGTLKYTAVNVVAWIETKKEETETDSKNQNGKTEKAATVTATAAHGVETLETAIQAKLAATDTTAAQLLKLVAGMVPVAELDAVMRELGYISMDQAAEDTDKALVKEKAAAKRRNAARRKTASKKAA
jgi:hypothetical protein